MNVEEALCRAFCDGITVSKVPAGLAVSTGFEDASGDRIGFYLVSDKSTGLYRIEDDGALVPTLVATGVNIFKGARAKVFQSLLAQGRIEFDEASSELRTGLLSETEIPAAAMRFVALLMRVASLSSTSPEMVSASFREDAISRIKADLGASFEIKEDEPVDAALAEFEPDLLLTAVGKNPVAVFVAVSDQRIYEAILMQMAANHEAHVSCSVVALMDRENSRLTTRKMRQRARNRLGAAPDFYGEEGVAVHRIAQEADRAFGTYLGPIH
ncbi:MAG TPA: DUF1828 domain-containing protein [Stellaceae bacterium]|nr:DUF1828 domain-containing protein [Stellaceae bacterium]